MDEADLMGLLRITKREKRSSQTRSRSPVSNSTATVALQEPRLTEVRLEVQHQTTVQNRAPLYHAAAAAVPSMETSPLVTFEQWQEKARAAGCPRHRVNLAMTKAELKRLIQDQSSLLTRNTAAQSMETALVADVGRVKALMLLSP